MSTQTSRSFADTPFARLLALVIAAGLAWFMYTTWGEQLALLTQGTPPAIPMATPVPDLDGANPALAECLASRVGDVDQMRADGMINDAQYANFRDRAENLCRVQNPG